MKQYIIIFLILATIISGSFYVGTLITNQKYLDLVNKEIKTQQVTNEKVKKYNDIKLCSVIGGKLSEDGECI